MALAPETSPASWEGFKEPELSFVLPAQAPEQGSWQLLFFWKNSCWVRNVLLSLRSSAGSQEAHSEVWQGLQGLCLPRKNPLRQRGNVFWFPGSWLKP